MAKLELAFEILAKDKASDAFDKVSRSAEKTGDVGRKVGLALAGAAAAGAAGLFAVLKGGAAEFSENQTALAQFEAGLVSTGNVAGITGAQVKALSDSIEAKTGTDGAAVVSGAALLASFTKVRNEVGAGNDVFTRATQAGVDLAARGFGSVESNAVTLGKALQDPLKGLVALGRQGVQFTDDQKATIASLVRTGDVLGAQKIILAEVETQVGGSAEAYGKTLPGQLERARHAFDGVKETVFKAVLPAVTRLLEYVTGTLIPGVQSLSDKLGPGLAATFTTKVVPAVKITSDILIALAGFFQRNSEILIPLIATVGTFAAGFIIATQVVKAYTAVQALLNVVLAANPIGLVILALVALVAGIVVAYKNSETFRNVVQGAFQAVKAAALSLRDAFTGAVDAILSSLKALLDFVKTLGSQIKSAVGNLGGLLVDAGEAIIEGLARGIRNAVGAAVQAARDAAAAVARAAKGVLGIKSPSRVFMDIGANVSRGFALGIESQAGLAQNALSDLTTGSITSSTDLSGVGSGGLGEKLDRIEAAILNDARRLQMASRQMAY